MSLAATADFAGIITRKLSLAEELQERGVPIVEKSIVHKHMRDTISKHRVGVYKLIGPLLYAFVRMMNTIVTSRHFRGIAVSILITPVAILILSVGAFILGVPFAGHVVAVALGVVVALPTFAMLAREGMKTASFANAAMIWIRITLGTRTPALLRSWSVPEHLIPRTMRAGMIPGVTVSKFIFGADPILEVSRGRFFTLERAYIGGWDTGVPQIDNS